MAVHRRARRAVKLSTKALISDRRGVLCGRIDGYTRRNESESEAREGEDWRRKDGERPLFTIVAVHDTAADVPTTIVRGVGLFLLEEIFERTFVCERGYFE